MRVSFSILSFAKNNLCSHGNLAKHFTKIYSHNNNIDRGVISKRRGGAATLRQVSTKLILLASSDSQVIFVDKGMWAR